MARANQVDELLDSLSDLDADHVAGELQEFDANDIVSALARRSLDGGGGGGSGAFTETVTVHVADETTPVLKLYNDSWDTDPNDPVVQVYAEDNGDAFMATANAGTTLQIGETAAGIKVKRGTGLGFFTAAAVAQPVVPLTTPSVQDVIDALVALGLVAQND